MSITVLLADDQAMVRAGFHMVLDAEPDIEVVGEAENGVSALEAASRLHPDVVLMDIQMPVMDGLEATRRLFSEESDVKTRVLILTTFDRDQYIFEALRAGASGFLLKNAPPEDLISAIHIVAAGDALLAPSVTRRIVEEFASLSPAPKPDSKVDTLTERELEVLRHIGRGMSNAEIADALFVGNATVKTHVSSVLGKLGLRDRVQAVVYAFENGLVRPGGI